jgi:hypothetical protein
MMRIVDESDSGGFGQGGRTQTGPLSETEERVWAGFFGGAEVDLGGHGDGAAADGGASWAPHRTVRSEVLADLLARFVDRTGHPRAALCLIGARITGELDLRHAEILTPMSFTRCWFERAPLLVEARAVNLSLVGCCVPGLRARLLQLRGDLTARSSTITGEVQVQDARIGGVLDLTGARLSNLEGRALLADRTSVEGDLIGRGSTVHGELSLVGAKVSGTLDLDGARLLNPGGSALAAERLEVGGSLLARHGFTAEGEVNLIHVRAAGQLNFVEATLAQPDGFALHVGGGRVGSLWLVFAERPVGLIRLSGLHAETIFDNPETWPHHLNLSGCTYQYLFSRKLVEPYQPMPTVPVDVHHRLAWLRRDPDGYLPQPYEQLAAVYRRTGHEQEARRVLLEKHRRRRVTLPWPGRLAGYLLDGLVGYGYRTWLAGAWLAAFWLLGTIVFTLAPPTPRSPAPGAASNPSLYTLDLLLPIINLHQEDTWRPTGDTQYIAALLILAGWVLTTAVVAGLTRILNRS